MPDQFFIFWSKFLGSLVFRGTFTQRKANLKSTKLESTKANECKHLQVSTAVAPHLQTVT